MFEDFRNKVSRAYGQFDKNKLGGLLPGGAQVNPMIGGTILAAGEYIPAITQGALGLGDRVDRSVDPRVQQALIDNVNSAKAKGLTKAAYDNYDTSTPGGFAAKHIFGDVPFSELRFDKDGNVTGLKGGGGRSGHPMDTNKSVADITTEMEKGIRQDDGTYVKAPFYKPIERELARHQDGGVTFHDLDFVTPQTGAPSASDMMSGILTPAPTRMAGEVDITVDSTAVPGPATNYAVQAGDTLSAIAADRGTTVAELVRRNNIANPDLIQIGQMIR